MKKTAIILAAALGVSAWSLTAQDQGGTPPAAPPPMGGDAGPGARNPRGGFHLLPPHAQEQLNLTAEQQEQIAALEKETKAKLESILTPEQMRKLRHLRPPGPPPGEADGNPPPSGPPPGQD